jgi:hypothetical protein
VGEAVTDQTEERVADAELAEWQRVAALGLGASPLTTQRLIVEVYRLRALLSPLVATEMEPTYYDREDWENCCYCRAEKPCYGPTRNDPFVHDADCPWLLAKEGVA